MQCYSSIFAHKSVKVCLPMIRISLFEFPIQSFFQLVTITDSIDVSSGRGISSNGLALA